MAITGFYRWLDEISQTDMLWKSKRLHANKSFLYDLMGPLRSSDIKTPRPYLNPFAIITFHNLRQYNTSTTIIPEEVVAQLDRYSNELPSLHRLLYDIFANTGLRLKEVFFSEENCIEPS